MSLERAAPQRLRAGFVRRVHGVGGEVRIEPCGGDVTRFTSGTRLGLEGDDRVLTVRQARDGGDGSVLLAFEEIQDARAAEALGGQYLVVDAAAARALGEDEWFTWQLIGLRVRSPRGADLGVVADVEPAVASDVLVIRGGPELRRYPLVRAFVKCVDIDAGTLTLDPQEEVQP